MARQRCTIDAIIQAADPVTLLEQYQELAATTKDIVSTDIPRSALDDFVDVGFLVKDAEVRSVVFDSTLIDPAYPDYDQMRQIVQDSLAAPAPRRPSAPASSEPAAPTDGAETAAPAPAQNPTTDVGDACAYDPATAAGGAGPGRAADEERLSPAQAVLRSRRRKRAEPDGQQPGGDDAQPDGRRRRPRLDRHQRRPGERGEVVDPVRPVQRAGRTW